MDLTQSIYGALRAQLAPPPYVDRYARRVGSQLTPQTYTPILQLADTGYLYQLCDLLDELRESDPHLHSVLAKREQQVAGAEMELRPPDNSGQAGEDIADWVQERLDEVEPRTEYGKTFTDLVSDLMGGVYYPRTGAEVVWRREGRWWIPTAFETIHPRRFALATDWRLHLWDALGEGTGEYGRENQDSPFGRFPGVPLDAFPPGKWIIHRPRVRGGHPTREGVGRLVGWYCLFKKWAVRDWLAFAEWAGRGLRIGTYNTGEGANYFRATPEDVAQLQAVLDAMSSETSAVIADTTKIDVKPPPSGSNDLHDRLVLLCNTEISKAVLGETLSTEVGSHGGNRALGEVHNEVRLALARADARAISRTLVQHLIRPMVRMNFGPSAPVPTPVFATDPREDRDSLAQRLTGLVKDAGLKVSQRWARGELGIDDPQDGDELLGGLGVEGQPAPAPTNVAPPNPGAQETQPDDDRTAPPAPPDR